jgi:hypothetical protein
MPSGIDAIELVHLIKEAFPPFPLVSGQKKILCHLGGIPFQLGGT